MTGWRLGYLAGPTQVIKAAIALQSQSTSNVCSFAQRGALAALQGPLNCVKEMALSFSQRRSHLTAGLQQLSDVVVVPPQGAFYAFPDISAYGLDSMTFCQQLLDKRGLAVVPGVAFGDDRCIRLSCAVTTATIDDGLERLESFFQSL